MKKTFVAVVLVIGVAMAGRHLEMVRSNPAVDTSITSLPDTIQLWFSQELEPALSRLTLVGPSGGVALGKAVPDPTDATSMRAPVEGDGGAGRYTVRWRAAGDDGHPVRGEFVFDVAAER